MVQTIRVHHFTIVIPSKLTRDVTYDHLKFNSELVGSLPTELCLLAVSLFCQYLCSGVPFSNCGTRKFASSINLGPISQSNKIHRKTIFQYHHSNLYWDIPIFIATTIDLQLRSILDLCEIGPRHCSSPLIVPYWTLFLKLINTLNRLSRSILHISRRDTSRRQWRQLPPCPMSLSWCPWNDPIEVYNFLKGCQGENALAPLPFFKNEAYRPTLM